MSGQYTYQLVEGAPNFIRRWPGGAFVPKENEEWADYEAWLAEGNTPLPADAPIPTGE